MRNTMADFWRMVWEQNVRMIVMVTALRHKDIVREALLIGVYVCACVGGSVLVLKEPADVWGNVLISFHELDKIFSFSDFFPCNNVLPLRSRNVSCTAKLTDLSFLGELTL